jgi:glyoxylase-like metal-dependent hydrolase (beta-lactamase superfamily II)
MTVQQSTPIKNSGRRERMNIAPSVFRLKHSRFSHSYYLFDEEVLIDTGLPFHAAAILDDLKALGGQVKTILLTHHDVDHAGNVRRIQEAARAAVYIGKKDAPFLSGEKHRPGRKRVIEMFLPAAPPLAYDTFPEEAQSRLGNIDIFHTPGHTPGHSIFRYRNLLFSGDLFREKNGRIIEMSSAMNWDNRAARRSLMLLTELEFEIACPSHGEPVNKERLLAQFPEKGRQ